MRKIVAAFLGLFFIILNFTLTNLAADYIVSDLGGNSDICTYTITFFGLGSALTIPLGKVLYQKMGTAKLFSLSLFLQGLFSLGCALSSNFPIFIIFRFLLGLASGPCYSAIIHLFSKLAPEEKQLHLSAIFITMVVVVPVLSTAWGGWIAYDLNWRFLFYFNAPIFLILSLYINQWKHLDEKQASDYDWIGYSFYFIGLGLLSSFLILGQQLDWFRSFFLCFLVGIGALCFIYFLLRSFQHTTPVLQITLLKNPVFSFVLINLLVLFSAYFGMLVLLGLWLHLYVNYTPIWIAVAIGTMAIAGIFPYFLIEKCSKLDPRLPLFFAILFLAISSYHTTFFNEEVNFGRIAFTRVVAGFGLALFIPPLAKLSFSTFAKEKGAAVLEMFHTVRMIASSLGVACYTTLWQRRQVFYHERMGEDLTVFSEIVQKYFADAKAIYLQGKKTALELNHFLDRKSTVLSLDDCFYLMMWLLLGLIVLLVCSLFFFRKKEPAS